MSKRVVTDWVALADSLKVHLRTAFAREDFTDAQIEWSATNLIRCARAEKKFEFPPEFAAVTAAHRVAISAMLVGIVLALKYTRTP